MARCGRCTVRRARAATGKLAFITPLLAEQQRHAATRRVADLGRRHAERYPHVVAGDGGETVASSCAVMKHACCVGMKHACDGMGSAVDGCVVLPSVGHAGAEDIDGAERGGWRRGGFLPEASLVSLRSRATVAPKCKNNEYRADVASSKHAYAAASGFGRARRGRIRIVERLGAIDHTHLFGE